MRGLSAYTTAYIELLRAHAVRHGYYLIGGTHPNIRDGQLLNTAFLFTPGGAVHLQDKIHRTRWEKEKWNSDHGDVLNVFQTPHGKIAILICYDIEFPEYQREPDVWNREQKQRLIDSILREFDISSIYFYRKEDDSLECIDGRQRLNAIMSFLGRNVADNEDNGFPLRFHNEIASSPPNLYEPIDGLRFAELDHLAVSEDDSQRAFCTGL